MIGHAVGYMTPLITDEVRPRREAHIPPRLLGPLCGKCRVNEATCAKQAGCCADCTHRFGEPAPPAPCGTAPGYWRHMNRGETTCQPCRDAWWVYQRAWARKRSAA